MSIFGFDFVNFYCLSALSHSPPFFVHFSIQAVNLLELEVYLSSIPSGPGDTGSPWLQAHSASAIGLATKEDEDRARYKEDGTLEVWAEKETCRLDSTYLSAWLGEG